MCALRCLVVLTTGAQDAKLMAKLRAEIATMKSSASEYQVEIEKMKKPVVAKHVSHYLSSVVALVTYRPGQSI